MKEYISICGKKPQKMKFRQIFWGNEGKERIRLCIRLKIFQTTMMLQLLVL